MTREIIETWIDSTKLLEIDQQNEKQKQLATHRILYIDQSYKMEPNTLKYVEFKPDDDENFSFEIVKAGKFKYNFK